MGYKVGDRLEVSIYINGTEYPLDRVNLLNFLHVGMTAKMQLPTCHFSVTDVQHNLDNIELQDGIPIGISIKAFQSKTYNFSFRKFHHKKTFNGHSFTYEVDGYLAVPQYWAGTSLGPIRGTSYDVLSQIAKTCGLNFIGDTTSDAQLWIPRSRTYSEFARKVASRGYVNDQSYMVLGIDWNSNMFYKNVTAIPDSPTNNVVLGQYVAGSYPATEYHPIASSGITNKVVGYQNTRFDQSMVGDVTSTSHSQVSYKPDAKAPLLNGTVKADVGQGYKSFGGIDVGNTNDSYEKAVYQNKRFASTYSLDVEFLLSLPTPFTLFDDFSFAVDTESQKADVPYAGHYVITGKAWYIQGATFAEKIVGTRQGLNSQYTQG